jgi:hypothetical protein
MNKNKNYMKIYGSIAMVCASGAFSGVLHPMPFWQKYIPQFMTQQQISEGVGCLKNRASAIMSKNYTIPQVYVWGGAIAFAGLAYLYGRQRFSLHNNLFSGTTSKCSLVRKDQAQNQGVLSGRNEHHALFGNDKAQVDDKIDREIYQRVQNRHIISHEDCMAVYPHIQGLLPKFELFAKHQDIQNSLSFASACTVASQNLASENNIEKLRGIAISNYKQLARLSGLLNYIVFLALHTLEKMKSGR